MTTATESLEILERFVGGYIDAATVALEALGDEKTPTAARRLLVGAFNYALEQLDMVPDHYHGLGVADDAMLLRVCAKLAVEAGATHDKLRALAAETADVGAVLGDLAPPLEKYVARFPERSVRGRTVDQILTNKLAFEVFEADVQRHLGAYKPTATNRTLSAEYHVGEVRRMIRTALGKAGLLDA